MQKKNLFNKIKAVYFNEKFVNVIKCAKHYNVDYKTFVKRFNNIIFKSIR